MKNMNISDEQSVEKMKNCKQQIENDLMNECTMK